LTASARYETAPPNLISRLLLLQDIEKTTNHDVKAVEYWIKEAFDKVAAKDIKVRPDWES